MSKPLIVAKTTEITHEAWLAARRKGIGGSDAAAVVGLSRYSSPLDIWLQKTRRKPATPDNEAMHWGRLLEPVVREEFIRRTGLTVKECPYLMAHKDYPFMLANVDGIVSEKDGTKAVLEIKTTNSFTTAKDSEDGLPVEWYCQVQHYLAVTCPKLTSSFSSAEISCNGRLSTATRRLSKLLLRLRVTFGTNMF